MFCLLFQTTVTRPSGGGSSTGDPHIVTYDGFYYHLYYQGEFLYARSSKRNFEVKFFVCYVTSFVLIRDNEEIHREDLLNTNTILAKELSVFFYSTKLLPLEFKSFLLSKEKL